MGVEPVKRCSLGLLNPRESRVNCTILRSTSSCACSSPRFWVHRPAEARLLSALPTRRRTFTALALCAAAYLYVFPYQARINNPNENARFYMTAAIAEQGTYIIDSLRARWGWVNDCAIHEGHAYSVKAPGTSLLGVPAYAAYYWGGRALGVDLDRDAALWICRVTASILPWLLFLFFFHRWLGRHTASALVRDAVFVSVALGSCLYGYGVLFMSHTLSAASAFGAFMLLFDAHHAARARWGRAFWAGLLTAGVTLFEYPGVLASLALSVYALIALRPRKWIPFAIGGLIPTFAMMHFQWACFGSPFSPGHLYVENDAFRAGHEQGFYGAVGLQWDALYGLLLHPGAGLFPLTPILVFGVLGLAMLVLRRRERADAWVASGIVLTTTLAMGCMNNWRGGWTIGPRYLVVVYPFLAWGAVVALDPLVRRFPRIGAALAIGLTAVGLLLSGLPSAYYPHFPAEVDRPLTQVVRVLIEHDYAPYAASNLVGVYGSASMIPLALVFLFALGWIAWDLRRRSDRALALVGGGLVAVALAWPLSIDPRPDDASVRAALGLITRTWTPAGHDAAAELARSLRGRDDPQGYRRLADLYDAEGRDREARMARARADALDRRVGDAAAAARARARAAGAAGPRSLDADHVAPP